MANPKRRMPAIGKYFEHLGGRLAPMLFERLIEMEWIRPKKGKRLYLRLQKKARKRIK